MSYFAAVLTRSGSKWSGSEVSLVDCENIDDIADVARDVEGDIRLLIIEQDDEYAVLARIDTDDDEPRFFLSDGHAADGYPMAALIADELIEIGEPELEDDPDAPPAHDSAPFGDPTVVEDLGTSAGELLALCGREGTLPVDLIIAVCDRAGCSDAFELVRA
jgi:putative tRNA adenosine deaminase-associated protein